MAIDPSTLTGYQLDIDPDEFVGNDGDPVDTAVDQSGNGRDLTAAGGARPVLKKAGNGINGHNIFQFNGTSHILSRANTDIIQNVGSASFFTVQRLANTSQDNVPVFFISRDAVGSSRVGFVAGQGDGLFNIVGRRLDADTFQAVPLGALSTGIKLRTSLLDWANANLTVWEDGTQIESAVFQTAGSTSNTASVEMSLGGSEAGTFCAVDIARTLIYVPKLSDLDRQRVEWYLAERFAISGPTNPDAGSFQAAWARGSNVIIVPGRT